MSLCEFLGSVAGEFSDLPNWWILWKRDRLVAIIS